MLVADITGHGPDLVLVHGITESARSWDPLIAALAGDHRVIAVDLRGHGRSAGGGPWDLATMAADVHEVVAAHSAHAPLLVGHSLGGTVVTAYAAARPARGVVNVDQSLALDGFQEALRAVEPVLRGPVEGFEALVGQLFVGLRGRLDDDGWARLEGLRRADQEVVLGIWAPVLETPAAGLRALVADLAGAVTVPYLALHGEAPGERYGPWLRGLIPTATVECWDGLGHYPHLVEPERFVARLRAFEATLAPAG